MWNKLKNNWKLILITAVVAFLLGFVFSGSSSLPRSEAVSATRTHEQGSQIWTCSMHPQIRMNEPGQCPICGMDLIPANDSKEALGPRELKLSENAQKLASIETVEVIRGRAVHGVRLVGKLTRDEAREKTISAWIGGRIDKMFVDITGEFVRKGDPLVSLYSPVLYTAQRELLQSLKSNRDRGSVITEKRLMAAEKKLKLLGMSRKQIKKVETSGKLTTHVVIRAPISGIVIHRNVREGSYVKVGQAMYRVTDLSRLWLELDAYESDIQWLQNGQSVVFQVEAYPGKRFNGKIVFVDPVMNPKTRSIRIRADVPNMDGLLKPDMFVHAVVGAELNNRGRVQKGAGEGEDLPLIVPASAPLLTGTRAVVYVAVSGKPGVFEGREVTLGPVVDNGYVVMAGLKEGEQVVVKGNFMIDSDLQIQAKASMMYPSGGAPASHKHGGMKMDAASKGPAVVSMEDGGKMTTGTKNVPTTDSAGLPDLPAKPIEKIVDAYLSVQTALAGDKLESARASSRVIGAVLQGISMGKLSPRVHHKWMPLHSGISRGALALAGSNTLAEARSAFEGLSLSLTALLKQFDVPLKTAVYRFHCPMAFDGKGADWVQSGKETMNPYFGSSMLRCGSLEETLDPRGGRQ